MEIRKIFYKSDFELYLESDTGWTVPFTARFFSASPKRFVECSFDGTEYTNCELTDDDRLHIVFDDPDLGLGPLYIQETFYLDNEHFQSGICDERLSPKVVTLTDPDTGTEFEVHLCLEGSDEVKTIGTLPAFYQKGEPGDDPRIYVMEYTIEEFESMSEEDVIALYNAISDRKIIYSCRNYLLEMLPILNARIIDEQNHEIILTYIDDGNICEAYFSQDAFDFVKKYDFTNL